MNSLFEYIFAGFDKVRSTYSSFYDLTKPVDCVSYEILTQKLLLLILLYDSVSLLKSCLSNRAQGDTTKLLLSLSLYDDVKLNQRAVRTTRFFALKTRPEMVDLQ